MVSPLAQDKLTVKEYKVPPTVELHPRQKLAYLEEQRNQIKAMHWRARVDMLHAKRLQESSNEVLKNKGYSNYAQHLNEMEQSIGAISMLDKYIDEFKKENPGLEAKPSDHPDGY
jgi:hypothetical protein